MDLQGTETLEHYSINQRIGLATQDQHTSSGEDHALRDPLYQLVALEHEDFPLTQVAKHLLNGQYVSQLSA